MASFRLLVDGEIRKVLGAGAFPHPGVAAADFPILRQVDPYDDTTFGRSEMPGLAAELQALLNRADLSPLERSTVEAVADLVRECGMTPGAQLVFFGD